MDLNNIKAVIFDCDGVMFDTAEANKKFYNELLEHFSKPKLTDEQFIKVHMFTVSQALDYLFPEQANLDEVYKMLKTIGYNKVISCKARYIDGNRKGFFDFQQNLTA